MEALVKLKCIERYLNKIKQKLIQKKNHNDKTQTEIDWREYFAQKICSDICE